MNTTNRADKTGRWQPDRVVLNGLEAIPTDYEMSDDEFNERIIDMHLSQYVADGFIHKLIAGK